LLSLLNSLSNHRLIILINKLLLLLVRIALWNLVRDCSCCYLLRGLLLLVLDCWTNRCISNLLLGLLGISYVCCLKKFSCLRHTLLVNRLLYWPLSYDLLRLLLHKWYLCLSLLRILYFNNRRRSFFDNLYHFLISWLGLKVSSKDVL